MYGGGQTYKPDKKIGKAAMENAKLGRDYLGWMKQRAKVTDLMSAQDRARSIRVFRPLEDAYIRDAQRHDSPGAQRIAANEARADVFSAAKVAREADAREAASMGVNPNSGRYRSIARSTGMRTSLAAAGASNLARNRVRAEGDAMRSNAINLGQGLAVNPLSSFTAGSGAMASGVTAAQGGNNSVIQAYSNIDQNKMQAQQNDAQASGALFQGLGTLAGFALMSDEKKKTRRLKAPSATKALRDVPIDSWEYKRGIADGGGKRHIGAMAQDWQRATGTGDGETIPIVDAIGVTMKAVKEIDEKVEAMTRRLPARKKAAA